MGKFSVLVVTLMRSNRETMGQPLAPRDCHCA